MSTINPPPQVPQNAGSFLEKLRTTVYQLWFNAPLTGSVDFSAADTSKTVTNPLVRADSVIVATVATNDSTMKTVLAVAAAGSFTIYANAAATGTTRVNYMVMN